MAKYFKIIFDLTMAIFFAFSCFFVFEMFEKAFYSHMILLALVWLYVPAFSFWIGTKSVRENFRSNENQKTFPVIFINLRFFLTVFASVTSLTFLSNYNGVRDAIGRHFIEGYQVSYYDAVDDNDNPYRASKFETGHWYSEFGLWIFGWIFLPFCLIPPFFTWRAATNNIHLAFEDIKSEPT